jgi:integrase
LAKVIVNNYKIIILDGTVEGKRHRLTTGKKADKRLLTWYKRHADDEFFKLYEHKFGSVSKKDITFREYGAYILDISQNNRNQFSQKEELQRFKKICETFGDMDIADIKASHVLKWQNDCGYAPKTIQNYRGTMNMILKMALYDDIITKNPLSVVKLPKKIRREIHIFHQHEIELLTSKATGQLKNILMFNFFAGLRGSELIALRWNDINFDSNTIRVDTRIREGIEDVTKSKRVRIIDMLPQARQALKNQQLLTGIKNDYVFLAQRGKAYRKPSNISEAIKTLCISCDIKKGTLQTVRKSCNTLLKQYGLPNDWILDQLGHIEDGVNREHYTGKLKPDLSKIGRVLAESKIG